MAGHPGWGRYVLLPVYELVIVLKKVFILLVTRLYTLNARVLYALTAV